MKCHPKGMSFLSTSDPAGQALKWIFPSCCCKQRGRHFILGKDFFNIYFLFRNPSKQKNKIPNVPRGCFNMKWVFNLKTSASSILNPILKGITRSLGAEKANKVYMVL